MTDLYNPFGSAFVDPAMIARASDPAPVAPANAPARPAAAAAPLPDLSWDAVKARNGWETAAPDARQRIHADYANTVLPWLAQHHGEDPAQWTRQFLGQVPTPTDAGDFKRGLKTYWPGTQAALYGVGALAADVVGADDTAGDWAQRAQGLLNLQTEDSRASDSLSGAWRTGEGIGGTVGNLADWAQFNLGQMVPSVVESIAFSLAGAAAGSSAAPGPGTIAGAVGGVFGKRLIREEVQAQIATMAAKHVAKRVTEGAAEAAAKREGLDLMRNQLAHETMRALGATGALATASTARGLGESYNAAYATEQAGGPQIDVGRVLAGGAIYGAAETFGDALLADTLLRGVRGQTLTDRVAAGFARNAISEGTTEAVQEGATRFAGQQSLTDADAMTAYLDSAAAGGIGGGVFGGIGAVRERPQPQGDTAFMDAMGTLASDRQVTPYRPLALPAPVLTVSPEGVAMTPPQRDAALRADVAMVREREAMGLTPDVNTVRRQHPAAIPNTTILPNTAIPTSPAPTTQEAPNRTTPEPKGVPLKVTTPEGEALLGFREKWGNSKVRVRRSDFESGRDYLPLFDAQGQPMTGGNLHRKLLADAQVSPAPTVPVEPAPSPAPANDEVKPVDIPMPAEALPSPEAETPAPALDRPALRALFVETMRRKFPNITDPERAIYARTADALADLIERRDARGLIQHNLGDAKANPASRAVFAEATGVRLPRGRGDTEDAIYRWAGTDRATEQAREAERRAQADAEKRAPVQDFPTFANLAQAQQWSDQRARAFGGMLAYRRTEEYRRLHPILRSLEDTMNRTHAEHRMQVLAAAGQAVGDRVEAASGALMPDAPKVVRGTVFAKSGFPWVRIDDGGTITVREQNKIAHRREVPWSDRWRKIAAASTAEAPVAQAADGHDRETPAPVQADPERSLTPGRAPSAKRGNTKIVLDFIDALAARIESGQSGRVDFPARFEHVAEVEHALKTLRTAFTKAGATASNGRYAVQGGVIALSNSANQLWADVVVDAPVAPREPQATTTAPVVTVPPIAESSPARDPVQASTPERTSNDAGAVQTEAVSRRRAQGSPVEVADRARDREPLDAGLAAPAESLVRGERVSDRAGNADRAGGEGESRSVSDPSVELGEGQGVGPAVVAPDRERPLRRGSGGDAGRLGRRGRGRVNEEAAQIEDRAASSANEAATSASAAAAAAAEDDHAAAPPAEEGLAEDLGKGGLARKARDNLAAIRIVQAMAAENRVATAEERRQLSRYVGWGALKGVFDPANAQWAKVRTELQGLLSDAQWRAARASVLNAHYTSKPVIDGMFAGLTRLGVTRGRILEPAVGIGHFFGGMPAKLRNASDLFGVELDPLTQQIAAALYPKANIRQSGFQDYAIPGEFFDVVIGNPPFGSEPIVDPERSPYSGFSIHNYFFAKAIDKLRPGGVLMMVVSRQFLDAKDSRVRQWIAERADLIGAARLPNTAFTENAGTEVVTDIIVLQKRAPDAASETDEQTQARLRWVQAVEQTLEHPTTGEAFAFRVNPYYVDHPTHILGTQTAGGTMYRANDYTVAPSGDLAAQLAAWTQTLPEGVYAPIDRTEAASAAEVPDGVKVGAYYLGKDGRILIRDTDRMGEGQATVWTPPTATAEARMRGMIELRNVLRQQMRLERSADAAVAEIESNRARLNTRYDAFLKRFGHLNAPRTNRSLFIDDPDASLLLALEFDFDAGTSDTVAKREGIAPRAPKATKADIFKRRVLFPPSDFVTVRSARDALVASLNYRGLVDPAYMTEVYGKDRDAIVAELGALVFETPDGTLVTTDDYLSGDVKTKLAEAKDAARREPRFARNVDALTKVIPRDKTPSEINIALGAPFLPVEDLRAFHREITGADARMVYSRGSGLWFVNVIGMPDQVLNASTWV